MTHDTEFDRWANKVWNFGSGLGAEVSLKDFRKDIIIEMYNEAGQLAIAYKIYRCWVSEFQALARSRCQRQRCGDPIDQVGKRRLGTGLRGAGAERTEFHRTVT